MRHEFALEAKMSIFHVEQERGKLAKSKPGERLAAGQASIVITALSLLCWVTIMAIAAGLRALI